MRPRRPGARATARAIVARRRLVRDRANPGGAPASPGLRLDREPNHVAEICDGDLEDHHEEDELPQRVRPLHPPQSTQEARPKLKRVMDAKGTAIAMP